VFNDPCSEGQVDFILPFWLAFHSSRPTRPIRTPAPSMIAKQCTPSVWYFYMFKQNGRQLSVMLIYKLSVSV
jgi:hypothetical protein